MKFVGGILSATLPRVCTWKALNAGAENADCWQGSGASCALVFSITSHDGEKLNDQLCLGAITAGLAWTFFSFSQQSKFEAADQLLRRLDVAKFGEAIPVEDMSSSLDIVLYLAMPWANHTRGGYMGSYLPSWHASYSQQLDPAW